MQCLKVDLRKVNFNKSAIWNVWRQFSIDLDTTKKKIDVTKHYMPEKEQERLRDYLLKHWKKLKIYKPHTRSKRIIQDSLAWEVLDHFPTSVKK